MADSIILTQSGLKELEEKLEYLKTVRRKEIAEEIKVARSFGDLSENAEYDEAKNEQAKIEGEIVRLEEMLKNAVVADESDGATVSIGKFVKLKYKNNKGETVEKEYQIVGTAEADIFQNKIPNEAPVAKAVMGKKVKDKVEVATPDGKTIKYTITGIRK